MKLEYLSEEKIWSASGDINGHPVVVEHPDRKEAFDGWSKLAWTVISRDSKPSGDKND